MAIRAANVDIFLYRGDDYPYTFTVLNSAGTAYNATGSAITITFKSAIDGTSLYTESPTTGVGGNIFASGIFVFTVPNATSAAINSDAVFDIQETTSGSKKNTLVYGKVILQKDVT